MSSDGAITIDGTLGNTPAPAPCAELERAYDWCRGVVRSRARNFYYGLRISPEPERSSVFALYAWMRAADDIVDDAGDLAGRRAAIDGFWTQTEATLANPSADGTPMWAAFGDVAQRYRLDRNVLHDVVRGMHADLDAGEAFDAGDGSPISICATRDDLAAYCDMVASTVGLCCVRIWGLEEGADPEEANRLAIARGRAFQMTNILRDYAEDFDDGRIYLPASDFERFGLTPQDLRTWAKPEACNEMVASLAQWAEDFYEESQPLVTMIREDCAPTLDAMSSIYRGLLAKIIKDPSAIAGAKRIRLSSVAKMAIALKCVRAAKRYDR